MPVLDIASSQPCSCFRNNVLAFRSETVFRNKLVAGNDRKLASSFSWKTFYLAEKKGRRFALGKAEFWRGRMMIKAISTLEITSIPCKKEGVNGYQDVLMRDVNSVKSNSPDFEPQSSSEVSTEVDEREKLRRMRISKANKGNTPWNKGRKHSPETLQRIKERTRLAMQDPKVKMKLVNLGHTQSDETRVKIGVGVRLGWERRRKKLMLQDTCLFEWQDLIAGAARRGLLGEEELQWDSYKILDSQLKEEWLQSIEQRKNTPRPKGSKRAPKSAEQKRKISEAIAAKWADPDYRSRVCSGLAKFHGIPEGVVRKPRKKPAGDGETQKRSFRKKDESNDVAKCKANIVNQLIKSKRNRTPSYRDPLASTKLEMLKNIRAQRSAAINKKSEAITRAKLLIAEAEKAANALEIAANTSPIAQASLTESRTLIAEATRLIESIESEDATTSFENAVTRLIESIESEDETTSFENENDPSESSTLPLNMHKMMNGDAQNQDDRNVNGFHSISTSFMDSTGNFSFNRFMLPDVADMVNGDSPRFCLDDAHKTEEKPLQASSNGALDYSNSTKNHADPKLNPGGITVNGLEIKSVNQQELKKQVKMIKKWVRGRLVEVTEEA